MAHSAPAASASHRSCRRPPPSPTPSRTPPASGSPSFRSRPSGSRWRSRPRPELLAPERAGEVTAGGLLEATPKLRVAGQEVATCGSQPHAATGSGAGPALDEVEASRLLELLQIAPRVAIGHAELDGGLPQRPSSSIRRKSCARPAPNFSSLPKTTHTRILGCTLCRPTHLRALLTRVRTLPSGSRKCASTPPHGCFSGAARNSTPRATSVS